MIDGCEAERRHGKEQRSGRRSEEELQEGPHSSEGGWGQEEQDESCKFQFKKAILCFVLRNAVEWKETGGRANSAQVLAVDGKGSNRNVRELVSCSSALPCRLQINFQNRSKTEKLDSQMSELQTGKKSEKRPASKPATKVNMSSDAPPPDINMAADELSKLTS
ncbi:hypothetical protein C0Q70_19577 [Pomacea canaliculata]|uniref:Uncharacterized protein n=1 Tax=Pomacea canaliculata TaxID=400727 RepID=A0A2T7NJQ8_POMCA|nr:hypothetical protein C0Q70_19577 [Pomacea canaliculata]